MYRNIISRSLAFFIVLAFSWLGCIQEQSIAPGGAAGGGGVGGPDLPYPPIFGQSPIISSFSPARGVPGTTITVTGSHFSTSPSVKVDGVSAVVLSVNNGVVTARVGAGTTTGKITVTNSNGFSGSSISDFIILDIPASGLVGLYLFDQNTNDLTASPANGTSSGSMGFTTDRFGIANGAVHFSGGFLSIGNPAKLQITGTITVSAWIRPSTLAQETANIVSKYTGSGGYHFYGYKGTTAPYRVAFSTRSNPPFSGCEHGYEDPFTPDGTWRLTTFVLDGNNLKYYVGTELVHEWTNHCPLVNGAEGNFNIGGANYRGQIDDVVVYNRALTPAEIQKLQDQAPTL